MERASLSPPNISPKEWCDSDFAHMRRRDPAKPPLATAEARRFPPPLRCPSMDDLKLRSIVTFYGDRVRIAAPMQSSDALCELDPWHRRLARTAHLSVPRVPGGDDNRPRASGSEAHADQYAAGSDRGSSPSVPSAGPACRARAASSAGRRTAQSAANAVRLCADRAGPIRPRVALSTYQCGPRPKGVSLNRPPRWQFPFLITDFFERLSLIVREQDFSVGIDYMRRPGQLTGCQSPSRQTWMVSMVGRH
jgi:hypothetical protein